MSIPLWVKMAAASKKELLDEVMLAIDELGGVDAAQEILRQMGSEKTSNWAVDERFIVAAPKTRDQVLEEFMDSRLGKTPKSKTEPTPKEEEGEAPRHVPEGIQPEKDKAPEPIKTSPEKMKGKGAYLAALLGLLMYGGGMTTEHLRNINLKKALADIAAGHDTAKVPSDRVKELVNEPIQVDEHDSRPPEEPRADMSEEEYKADKEKVLERMEVWQKQIADEEDPQKQESMQEELEEFVRYNQMNHPDLKLKRPKVKVPEHKENKPPTEESINKDYKEKNQAVPWSKNKALKGLRPRGQ